MSQALSALAIDFTPTPLQQAAINRIQQFQEELKQHGYVMRSGMELEFMIQDSRGALIPISVNMEKLNQRLIGEPTLPLLHYVKRDFTSDYEAIIGDAIEGNPARANIAAFSPLGVAATVATLKQGGMQKLLLESGCYNMPNPGQEPSPIFHAYPYSLSDKNASLSSNAAKSSAMHINVSLYDLKGHNAFSENHGLARQCAQTLVHVQNQAALAFLPRTNSLKRLGPQAHASVPGGLGMEEISANTTRRYYSSVNLRGGVYEGIPINPRNEQRGPVAASKSRSRLTGLEKDTRHEVRIENRLPGADADPFVALAVTMAALVQAVREQEKGPAAHNHRYELPKSRSEMAETLASSRHMHELLGPDLHTALINSVPQPMHSTP